MIYATHVTLSRSQPNLTTVIQ